jgi:cytosine/adenosine deaminase-related metal-dependent hydrolase
VGLHASFTLSDEALREAGRLARDLGTVVHVHVAEDLSDVADARARGTPGPLERLLALEALPRGSILAHGVHLSPEQVALANAGGMWLVQNPRSNEGNRVGYPRALRHGTRVALGTDGWEADMAVEEGALLRLAAAEGDDRAGGRLAAGHALVAERFGTASAPMAPGAVGDLVVRERGRVRHVVVDGRVVVEDGRLVAAGMDEIAEDSRREGARLWQRMAAIH